MSKVINEFNILPSSGYLSFLQFVHTVYNELLNYEAIFLFPYDFKIHVTSHSKS